MIEQWLQKFENSWENHDIDEILSLFDAKVEYWETPFQGLLNIDAISNEWDAINKQSNIDLTTSLFSQEGDKSAVKWDLAYMDELNEQKHWSGVYLIKLNQAGKCVYFLQVGEQQI